MKSRRQFLMKAPLGLIGAAASLRAQDAGGDAPPPGAPPTFGSAPATGPAVSALTFAESEKLAQVTMTPAQREHGGRELARRPWPAWRRAASGPHASRWLRRWRRPRCGRPRRPCVGARAARAIASCARRAPPARCPRATRTSPSRRSRSSRAGSSRAQLTSERLTQIYLERIERFDPKLRCVITLTARPRARAGEAGRRGDRGRTLSRAAARHSVRREGPARYRRHRDHLRRGAVSRSRARRRRRGGAPAARRRARCWWPS